MNAGELRQAARWLVDAHARREKFQPLPAALAPRSEADAYGIQDDYVALRSDRLGAVTGYKIALSTPQMQRFVGVDRPQAGCIHESTLRRSPALVRCADYVRLIVEFEIAVHVAEDMPAADAPYTRERVAASVGAVMPALELADDREADYAQLSRHPLHLIADNTWNEGAVLGSPVAEWRGIDLGAVRGVAWINGESVGEGFGAAAMGHPLDAVAWIADHLARNGRGLLRGDVVITGSLITSKNMKPGDRAKFSVERLGDVELSVE